MTENDEDDGDDDDDDDDHGGGFASDQRLSRPLLSFPASSFIYV